MKIGDLKRIDVAHILNTPEAQAAYINLALDDGDPEEIRNALNTVARARGMSEIAKATGLSREGLYKSLGEAGNPEFVTVMRVMSALGLKLTAKPAPARKPRKKVASAA